MDRKRETFKETYEQVGQNEYNEINPYQKMLQSIRSRFPEARITKTETLTDVYYEDNNKAFFVPIFIVKYNTGAIDLKIESEEAGDTH